MTSDTISRKFLAGVLRRLCGSFEWGQEVALLLCWVICQEVLKFMHAKSENDNNC